MLHSFGDLSSRTRNRTQGSQHRNLAGPLQWIPRNLDFYADFSCKKKKNWPKFVKQSSCQTKHSVYGLWPRVRSRGASCCPGWGRAVSIAFVGGFAGAKETWQMPEGLRPSCLLFFSSIWLTWEWTLCPPLLSKSTFLLLMLCVIRALRSPSFLQRVTPKFSHGLSAIDCILGCQVYSEPLIFWILLSWSEICLSPLTLPSPPLKVLSASLLAGIWPGSRFWISALRTAGEKETRSSCCCVIPYKCHYLLPNTEREASSNWSS